jgi:dihydropteroate synthase
MSTKDTAFRTTPKSIRCGNKTIDFVEPKIMGVLNLTPDSFFDGGKFKQEKHWIEQTAKMLNEGADIIDLGAVSTRPGAKPVEVEEELNRIISPLEILTTEFPQAIFSVDTYRAKVASECIDIGAQMINDISGGNFDKMMFETIARYKVPYVLMHIQGTPQNMQSEPISENVVGIIQKFFRDKVNELHALGLEDIFLDPGFGFGKTIRCNYSILNHLEDLRISNLPILGGISRKSMINKIISTKPSEALNGTTVLNTISLLNGANMLRVHDVKEATEAIEIVNSYKEFQECK